MMNKEGDTTGKSEGARSAEIQFLGIAASDLTGVSIEELAGNKTAITMLVHYHRQFSEENTSLKTDLTSLQTYVEGFREKKVNARTGAILLALSNVFIGFGVNLITNGNTAVGICVLIPGLCLTAGGLYFSLKKVD